MVCFKCDILAENEVSQAQVMARASFSTCAYRRSVSDSDLKAYATGIQVLCDCWRRTAPSLYEEASDETFVAASGPKWFLLLAPV